MAGGETIWKPGSRNRMTANPCEYLRHDDHDGNEAVGLPRPFLFRIRAGQSALGAFGQRGDLRQRGAEGDVDMGAGAHRPAVGIADGAEVAAPELEPDDDPRRAGDRQQAADKPAATAAT